MKLVMHKEVSARVPATAINCLFDLVTDDEGDPDWPGQVNLIFTTDAQIKRLNRDYRSKDKSTDVLSFNLDPPQEPHGVFGEIYISVPYARRQARGYGGGIFEELLRLSCHGFLHLFGYDHMNDKDARTMFDKQDAYLQQLRKSTRK